MASIFDIPIEELGGPRALTAFEYQHRVAVGELLRLANETDRDFIEFDSHDDILVHTRRDAGAVVEFVQVKAHSTGLHWTPSDLYSDDRDSAAVRQKSASSLIAKQLRRATGDDTVAFRLVTKLEVNQDLAVLKQDAMSRDAAAITALKDNLVPRFDHLSFPKARTVGDWIDQMRWHVAGLEQAVDDRNLHSIADAVFAHFERALTPTQARELYQQLLGRARHAAAITMPRDQKGCTRGQLLEWLGGYCAKLPIHLPPDVQTVLASLEREATERCVGRWQNAGLPLELAQELAGDESVGADAVRWLQEQSEDFLWVNGQFGAGKSLAADRIFQHALRGYRSGKEKRIPVFLEAKALLRTLSEEISARAAELGAYYRQGVYAVIDGADERTHQEARQLVQDAANYLRANPGSKVIITSSILEVTGLEPKSLPLLSEHEADAFLSKLTGEQTHRFFYLDGRFYEDLRNPFFIIQCARFGQGLSRAELVRRMVAAAIERIETAIQPAEDLLARLAVWQFDMGSPLIPERELGLSRAPLNSVLQTRLVERRGEHLLFTIECVAQWFAAQAIERRLVSILDLVNDVTRLERWQFALAMVLNHADEDVVDEIMHPLAEAQPAFASLVLRDGLLDWSANKQTRQVSADEVARRLRGAMQDWKIGLEPLSDLEVLFPITRQKQLMKIAASSQGGEYMVNWHERPDLPAVSSGPSVPLEPAPGERSVFWYAGILDHPAWAWKTTHGNIKSPLARAIDPALLASFNEGLRCEVAWEEGCSVVMQSRLRCERIPLSPLKLQTHYHYSLDARKRLMATYVKMLLKRGLDSMEAPYPQSDQGPPNFLSSESFSLQRMTQRANAVYQTALEAYRDVVEGLFPKMAKRFPRHAAWPYDLTGVVYLEERETFSAYALDWEMLSLPIGAVGQVRFSSCSAEDAREHRKNWQQRHGPRSEEKPSWYLESMGGTALQVWGTSPAAEIVKDWIESDLRAVGWR